MTQDKFRYKYPAPGGHEPIWISELCQRRPAEERHAQYEHDGRGCEQQGLLLWKEYLPGYKDWSIDCDALLTEQTPA